MSKKEKIDIKNKIDAILYAMNLIAEKIDSTYVGLIRYCDNNEQYEAEKHYAYFLENNLCILEDIRAEYQKRLSQ